MQRILVGIGIDRDGRDAHPARRLDDPAGDLAAVGDQDFWNMALAPVYWRLAQPSRAEPEEER